MRKHTVKKRADVAGNQGHLYRHHHQHDQPKVQSPPPAEAELGKGEAAHTADDTMEEDHDGTQSQALPEAVQGEGLRQEHLPQSLGTAQGGEDQVSHRKHHTGGQQKDQAGGSPCRIKYTDQGYSAAVKILFPVSNRFCFIVSLLAPKRPMQQMIRNAAICVQEYC